MPCSSVDRSADDRADHTDDIGAVNAVAPCTQRIQTYEARGSTKKRSRKKSPHEIHAVFTRAQQDSRLYNLKLDINDLKAQLRELAVQRELLHARSFFPRPNSDVSVLRTVGRYFHGFEPGYRGEVEHPDQNAFVRSIVEEDFSLGVTGLGVDMLLEQWKRYTELFHVRETYLHSAEVISSTDDDASFVVAKCVMDFRGVLTRTAVDMIFPSARRDPELLLQALGREIAIPMLFHLYFNEDGRLVRHDAIADFFGAVREAVGGNICTAVRFIADAHVGQESMLGPIAEPVVDAKSTEVDVVPPKRAKTESCDTSLELLETVSPATPDEDEPALGWMQKPWMVSPDSDVSSPDEDPVGENLYDEDRELPISPYESPGRHSMSYLLSPP